MDFANYSVEDWNTHILAIINQQLSKFGGKIDKSQINIPLISSSIGFTSNDLYELYMHLSQETKQTIRLNEYSDFLSVGNISETMYKSFHGNMTRDSHPEFAVQGTK